MLASGGKPNTRRLRRRGKARPALSPLPVVCSYETDESLQVSKNAKKKLEKRMKVAVAKYPLRTIDPMRSEILRQLAPDVGDMLALSLQTHSMDVQ